MEKFALFCKPASGSTFSSTAIEIIKWAKKIAVVKAKVIPHLETWVRVGRIIPQDHNI
jgi:hypothetical protein